MNLRETVRFAAFLSVRWPGRPRDEDWAKAWAPDFEPYTLEEAVAAARRWRSAGKIAPEGDDLLALIHIAHPAETVTELEFCAGLAERLLSDGYSEALIVDTIEHVDGVSVETARAALEVAQGLRQIEAR